MENEGLVILDLRSRCRVQQGQDITKASRHWIACVCQTNNDRNYY